MSLRGKTVLLIASLEMQIKDMELARSYAQDEHHRQALQEQLHDLRQSLAAEKEKLKIIDTQWVMQKQAEIEVIRREMHRADPGKAGELSDLIQDLSFRIDLRRKSIETL